MRLKLVMKDREYRDALAERIRRSRRNLYVIIEDNFRMEEDTLLVTDVGEGKLREGMVLLSSECRREVEGKGPYVLFKYAGVDALLTDLRLCAFLDMLNFVRHKNSNACPRTGCRAFQETQSLQMPVSGLKASRMIINVY